MERRKQTNTYLCSQNCPMSTAPTQCCRWRKGFRLGHYRAICGVCKSKAQLACTNLSCNDREKLKQGQTTGICCNTTLSSTAHTTPSLKPVLQSANSSTPDQTALVALVNANSSNPQTECSMPLLDQKNSSQARCVQCVLSRHLACKKLHQKEIRDGCRTWSCCGKPHFHLPVLTTVLSRKHFRHK